MELGTENRLTARMGLWSAAAGTILFLAFTICFVSAYAANPMFTWTNLLAYITYVQSYNQVFKDAAQLAMLLFGPVFIILLSSIHECTRKEFKVLTRTATYLGIIFAACIDIHYFIQLSTVRLSIAAGQVQGLEQFVQGNPISASAAINLLGWTLFLGLASIFLSPVFSGNGLERVIRIAFLANGIICLLGGVGFVANSFVIVFLTMNFGMGAALLVAMIALGVLFRRMERAGTPGQVRLGAAKA